MNRSGFSLVELLVVSAVGGLLLVGVYGTLAAQRHAFTLQSSQVETQQSARAGLDVLLTELRSLSPGGGDVITIDDDSITMRVMRTAGLICDVTYGGTPVLTALPVGAPFLPGDSLFVFADGDRDVAADDAWIAARAGPVDTLGVCNGAVAQRIDLPGAGAAFAADSVRSGGLVRAFEWRSYGLGLYGGHAYLGTWTPGSSFTPLVGPLDATAGPALRLDYYDALGNPALTPSSVHRIDVMVRAASPATTAAGAPLVDSLVATVFSRN